MTPGILAYLLPTISRNLLDRRQEIGLKKTGQQIQLAKKSK